MSESIQESREFRVKFKMTVSRDSLLEAGDWEQGAVPRGIKFGEELNRRPVTHDSLSETEKK